MKQWSFVFEATVDAYLEAEGPIANKDLYVQVRDRLAIGNGEASEKSPVGKKGDLCNLFHRQVRWVQQSLKQGGLLESVSRGHWEIHKAKRQSLKAAKAGKSILAYSTDLSLIHI